MQPDSVSFSKSYCTLVTNLEVTLGHPKHIELKVEHIRATKRCKSLYDKKTSSNQYQDEEIYVYLVVLLTFQKI